MKTILLATAAAALFAAPAFAQDAIGSVGVTYSNPSIEVAGDDDGPPSARAAVHETARVGIDQ